MPADRAALLERVEEILETGIRLKWKYDQNDPQACLMGWCGRDAYFKDRATAMRGPWLTAYDALSEAIGHDAVCDLITYSERKRTAVQQLALFQAASLRALAAAQTEGSGNG